MDGSKGNGSPHWGDDIFKEVLERLKGFGSGGEADDPQPGPNGAGPGEPPSANGDGVRRRTPRHPEEPLDAVPDAGQEVVDPERIRIKAARLGIAAGPLDPDYFASLVRSLYRSVHRVRAGAVVMPGQRKAGEQLKVSAATDTAMEGIRADGKADEDKADRLESKWVPRTEKELEDAEKVVEATKGHVEDCRRRVEELQEADEEDGVEGTTRIRRTSEQRRGWEGKGGLFGHLSLSRGKAAGVFGADVVGTTLVLSTKVADVFEAPLELAIPIALALSLAILVASFFAAMAAAAIRLPGRVAGLVLVAIYVLVLLKFIPGLDALRESDSEGVQAMTAATLAACFVAGFTGYITATREDRREEVEERELKKSAGTPLRHAMLELEEAEDDHARARRRAAHIEYALSQLWEEIEQFRDSGARAEVAAMKRRRAGVDADVEAAAIEATVATGVEQERAAAEWATVISLVAQEKARLEEPPDEKDLRLRLLFEDARSGGRGRGLSTMQRIAVGLVGVGAATSLAFGVVPLGLAMSGAVVLYLFDQRKREEADLEGEQDPAVEGIVSPASDEDQRFGRQPDEMRSKYGDGGAKSAESQ